MASQMLQPSNSIVANHVSLALRGRTVLKGINLQIFQGEIFGIYGRSGSGKTSLMRALIGLESPVSGRVSIQTEEEDDSAWIESIPAAAMQTPAAAPDLTVQENLQLFSRLWGLPRRGRASRIARYLEMLDLTELRGRRSRDLPYGAKLRLELARALLPESLIVMIDSLLETLHGQVRLNVWRHLQAQARSGAAVIITTSSPREVGMCDRMAVLNHGRLEYVGTPDELLRSAKPDLVVVQAVRPPLVRDKIKEKLAVNVEERDGGLVFSTSDGEAAVREIMSEMGSDVSLIYLRRPDLADVLETAGW